MLSQILPDAEPLPPDLIATIQASLIRTEAVDAFADWHDAAALRAFLSRPQSAIFQPALSLTLFGEPATPAGQGIPALRPFATIAAAWAAARDHFQLGTNTDRLLLRLLVLEDGSLTLDACRVDHWDRRGPDRTAELSEARPAPPGL